MFDFSPSLGSGEGLATYYAGADLSKLSVDGTDAVSYWSGIYGRSLQLAADKPESVKTVSFVVVDPLTGASKTWATVVAGGGVVQKPSDPALFGYTFDGWYTDPAFTASSRFEFDEDGAAAVSSDTTLHGRYTLVLDVDVPLASKVEIDAAGNVEAAAFDVVSRTPVAVSFSQVTSAAAPGASKLVPRAEDLAKVTLDL